MVEKNSELQALNKIIAKQLKKRSMLKEGVSKLVETVNLDDIYN